MQIYNVQFPYNSFYDQLFSQIRPASVRVNLRKFNFHERSMIAFRLFKVTLNECKLPSPRILDCNEIIEKEEKFKRKANALDTAIALYIEEGDIVRVKKI